MTTVKQIKDLLAQFKDDQEVVISAYSGHHDSGDVGVYAPLSNVSELFEIKSKQLVKDGKPVDMVAIRLSGDVSSLFPSVDDVPMLDIRHETTVEEVGQLFSDYFAFDPEYFASIASLTREKVQLEVEIANLEENRDLISKAVYNDEPLSGVTLDEFDSINAKIADKLRLIASLSTQIKSIDEKLRKPQV